MLFGYEILLTLIELWNIISVVVVIIVESVLLFFPELLDVFNIDFGFEISSQILSIGLLIFYWSTTIFLIQLIANNNRKINKNLNKLQLDKYFGNI